MLAAARSLRSAAAPHSPTILDLHKLPQHHPDDLILPPDAVISLLDSFAKSLLLDRHRLSLLKSAAADSHPPPPGPSSSAAAAATAPSASKSSILKSSNTVLTYMTWGIKHIEKAAATPAKETRKEHLKKAEQMLRSLTDSMQDLDRSSLASARVPNAAAIAAVAHFFLALVWKLRKNCARNVASHLLQAFVVCPKNARQTLAPELWRQLFQPHLSAVEAWYRHERSSIAADPTGGAASSAGVAAAAPMPSAVFKANYLMDLVAGMNGKKSNSGNLSERKRAEKMVNMQVNLLADLYEQSLDDGTQQYARKYQDLIANYFDDSMESCRSSGPENSFALSDAETQQHQAEMAAAAAASRHRDAIASAGAKIFPKDRIAPLPLSQLQEQQCSSSLSSADSLPYRHAGMGGGAPHPETTHSAKLPPPEAAGKLTDGRGGNPHLNRYGERTAGLSIVKKGSSGLPNQASLLRMCSKIYRPEVLDPLKNMLMNEAQSAPIGRHGRAKTRRRRRPPSLRQGASGPLSASNSRLLKAHSNRSMRLIDLMAHESNSYSDSDKSPPPSLRSYIREQRRSIAVASTAGSDAKRRSRRRDHFKGTRTSSEKGEKTTIKVKKVSRSRSSSRAEQTLRDAQIKMVPARSRRRGGAESRLRAPPPQLHGRNGAAATLSSSSRSNFTACCRPITPAPEQMLLQKSETPQQQQLLPQRRSSGARSSHAASATGSVANDRHRNRRPNLTGELQRSPQLDNPRLAATPARPPAGPPSVASSLAADPDFLHIRELAMELVNAVTAARRVSEKLTSTSAKLSDAIARCEESLLKFSHAWLNRKLPETKKLLDELIDDLLYVLGVSELQEVQRLALCLLSSTAMAARSTADDAGNDGGGGGGDDGGGEGLGLGLAQKKQKLSSHDPQVLQALSNLLKQPARLPEAALLLHLLHPGRYSAACNHYLPHLLPLLLDLVKKQSPEEARTAATPGRRRSQEAAEEATGNGSARAMALMMMSRLLAAVEGESRRQACRHVLLPGGAIGSLMESLDSGAAAAEEKAAAAFILTTCMQSGDEWRSAILTRVKVPSLLSLLHLCSSSSMASFRTAIDFASHLLCSTFRKLHMAEMLQRFQQDGMLNCMHSLMSYIQMAPIENQPSAAGLLLQLDLLLGDEQRYSIFREEAIDALLSPLILDNNQEACVNAIHVLCTIGSNHSEKELEVWLLKKAGLAGPHKATTQQTQSEKDAMSASPSSSCDSKDSEDHGGVLGDWDGVVSRTLMSHKGGLKVSYALGKGLRSELGQEVRRSCIMVIAWLTSHLISNNNKILRIALSPQHNSLGVGGHNRTKLIQGIEHLTQSIQLHLRSIVATGSPYAIDERVFAALALQNLGLHTT